MQLNTLISIILSSHTAKPLLTTVYSGSYSTRHADLSENSVYHIPGISALVKNYIQLSGRNTALKQYLPLITGAILAEKTVTFYLQKKESFRNVK